MSVIGVNVEQLPWLCVLEFMQYGDLGGVLEAISSKNISLFETELLHLSLQIVKGMKFIASQVIHGAQYRFAFCIYYSLIDVLIFLLFEILHSV